MTATKRVLIPLAHGAEEMEAVILADVLRRAGIEVVLAGVDGVAPVVCSRQVRLLPDCAMADCKGPYDLVLLPGGAQGARALAGSARVQELLREQDRAGRLVGAICAAPVALVAAGVGQGRNLTSHPSVQAELSGFGSYREQRVVRDGTLLTSRGPGTAFEFALACIEALLGKDAAARVAAPMLLPAQG
jgi:protein DJ-1